MSEIDITGLDKAKVLVALYNGSFQQGMGVLHPLKELTIEEANLLLSKQTYFDYLGGKVLKINLAKNTLRTDLYNRDVGINAAENIINKLKEEQK